MPIRTSKRTNDSNVFGKVVEQTDPSDAETEDSTPEPETAESSNTADNPPEVDAVSTTEPSGPDADDPASSPSRRKRWPRRLLAGAAGVVFVAALGLSGFLGWQLKQHNDTTAAGRAALAVAQTYAVTLTSIDFNQIDQNAAQVLDGATGEFKDEYGQSAAQLRQVLIDNKAMSKGTVVDSAIKSASKTKVVVLLFVDQSITNVVNPDARIDRSRVAITMELIDNRWLASKVDIK